MTDFEFIPAIDVLGGRCVQLTQGKYDRATIFDDDPAKTNLRREWESSSGYFLFH